MAKRGRNRGGGRWDRWWCSAKRSAVDVARRAASEINAETLVVNINMTNMAKTKSENSIQRTAHKMPH